MTARVLVDVETAEDEGVELIVGLGMELETMEDDAKDEDELGRIELEL